MKKSDVQKLKLGLYEVFWKSGGSREPLARSFKRRNMSALEEILSELRSSDAYDAKLAEKLVAEIRELKEYERLYNIVARDLNSANFRLSEISKFVYQESGLTQRAADLSPREALPLNQHIPDESGGAFFVHWSCSNCLPDDFDSSDRCHHCGNPRTAKLESR